MTYTPMSLAAFAAVISFGLPAHAEDPEPNSCLFKSGVGDLGHGGSVHSGDMVFYDDGDFLGTLQDIAGELGLEMHHVSLPDSQQRPSSVKVASGRCFALTFQDVSPDKANMPGYGNLTLYFLGTTPNFIEASAQTYEFKPAMVNVNDPPAVACVCNDAP